ncbi:pyridoxal phosphate-dependent transferase [Endogone sp. FLAS-F59071]|nr:pyridoxal phosphate-dependent transferase [Endogone sp. FLAS-F59071]|eukprot:RUS12526.1 pyridoxal phosphate-dependent transferase [Endogone sp. FLAS-F59071]
MGGISDEKFLTTNQRRLAESYERLTHFLRSHSINYLPAQAGHFIFIDLRSFLPKPPTSNGPVPDGARQAERALARSFIDHGVYIAAGEAFHSEEEGWFRLTFAIDWEMLQIGLKRMMTALSKVNPLAVAAARKSAEEGEANV